MRHRTRATATAMDGAGVMLSTACTIHCLVFPLALVILPSWSSALSLPEEFHLMMVALAVPLSSYVLLVSRHRADSLGLRLGIGFTGLALMVGALFVKGELLETGLTSLGAAMVASAHILNWRSRARRSAALAE